MPFVSWRPSMSGVVRTSAWDLAVECVDRALGEGAVPSLVRLGRLGQLGSLPSFVAALGEDDDPSALALDVARASESRSVSRPPRRGGRPRTPLPRPPRAHPPRSRPLQGAERS